jgi:peptidyl-prolyl cis-trans isomerase C
VAATVNGYPIPAGEIDRRVYQRTPKQVLESPGAAGAIAQQRARYLDSAVENRLVDEQAEAAGIKVTDADVDQDVQDQLQAYLSNFGLTRDQFDTQLRTQRRQSLDEFLAERRADTEQRTGLARKRLLAQKAPDAVKVSDEEIQQYYDKNRDRQYARPEQVRASQILIATGQMTAEQKAAARTKAEQILAEARRPGADFAALAARYSDCPSKAKGGDLGFSARRGGLVEPLAAAIFALQVGQISDLIETDLGYHFVKVTDKAEPRTLSLDEVRRGVAQTLREQKLQAEMRRYAAELRSKAQIVYGAGWGPPATGIAAPLAQPPSTAPASSQPAPGPK